MNQRVAGMNALRIIARTLVIIIGLLVYGFVSYLLIDYGVLDDPIHAVAALTGIGGLVGYTVRQSIKPETSETEQEKAKE